MTNIKAIAAVSRNNVIGKKGDLPWRIPGELKWFKKITMGHIMIMGRKTWDSLPGILPGRENWVLSSTLKPKSGITIFSSFESALNEAGSRTIFIIGGGQIYSSLLPQCSELYITEVQQFIENGDAFFPSFEKEFTPTETLEENKEFVIKKWKRIAS
jgi:dihydrofolate reductase